MMGAKAASAAARRYSSVLGKSPAKPPMSKPQKGTPVSPSESPAVSCPLSSEKVDNWSPAQWAG